MPSEDPNVLRIVPATGSGRRPLTSENAISGRRRTSWSPRAFSAFASISRAARSSATRAACSCCAALSLLGVDSGDQVLERRGLVGEVGGPLLLRAERRLRRGQRLRARVDERGETRLFVGQGDDGVGMPLPLLGDRRPRRRQVLDVMGEPLRSPPSDWRSWR